MPAVNYDLMLRQMVKMGGAPNQVVFWSRPVGWKNQTLTPNPDTVYFMPFFNTKDVGPVVLEIPPSDTGTIVGSVLRRPGPDDFRIGPPVAASPIDDADRRITEALAPLLLRHGIALAGVDVIGGRLIEVNITCPGGMHKTDALLGTDLSGVIMRRLLDPLATRPAQELLS